MSSLRIHIAAFLLVLFLVPQVNNALHYFVLDHDFTHKQHDKENGTKKSNKHNCDTSIFKTPAVTTVSIVSVSVPFVNIVLKIISHYSSSSFKEQNMAYRLRGPPLILPSAHLTYSINKHFNNTINT